MGRSGAPHGPVAFRPRSALPPRNGALLPGAPAPNRAAGAGTGPREFSPCGTGSSRLLLSGGVSDVVHGAGSVTLFGRFRVGGAREAVDQDGRLHPYPAGDAGRHSPGRWFAAPQGVSVPHGTARYTSATRAHEFGPGDRSPRPKKGISMRISVERGTGLEPATACLEGGNGPDFPGFLATTRG